MIELEAPSQSCEANCTNGDMSPAKRNTQTEVVNPARYAVTTLRLRSFACAILYVYDCFVVVFGQEAIDETFGKADIGMPAKLALSYLHGPCHR